MSEIIELTVTNGQPTTTSLAIAERFGKQHKNVLQSIENLECSEAFTELNFQPSAYKDSTGRALPMYAITKDGFMFLCMGFTGKEAAAWKERFIAAFNVMERQLLANAAAQQLPKPDGTLYLSHSADIMVAADRIFRGTIRSSRSAGLALPAALRRANAVALEKTGIDMLHTLQAEDHLAELDARAAHQGQPSESTAPRSVQEFWRDWFGGTLGLPYAPCLTGQAYSAYQHWCKGRHVRWLNEQGQFTACLMRHASWQGQPMRAQVVRLHAGTAQACTARMLVIGELPYDEPIGQWASAQVNLFEKHLKQYCAAHPRAAATV